MVKKIDPLRNNKNKLDLAASLAAIDFKNKSYYNDLPDDLKKQYSAFVYMRFLSSTPDQNGLHEYHLLATNDIVNQDFWLLSKDPEFMHLLMCLVGLGRKCYHPWIAGPKNSTKDKVRVFFNKIHPGINKQELDILYNGLTPDDFKTLCKDYALEDKEIKDLVENFKKLKESK